jgi:uncharacterized membrane protein
MSCSANPESSIMDSYNVIFSKTGIFYNGFLYKRISYNVIFSKSGIFYNGLLYKSAEEEIRGNVIHTAVNTKSYLLARLLALMGDLTLKEKNLMEKGTFCLFILLSGNDSLKDSDFTFYSSLLLLWSN